MRHMDAVRSVPNGPGGHSWIGIVPLHSPAPAPGPGVCVVYVLYNDANEPIYVGSTEYFQLRLAQHVRDGKPVTRWMAFPCADRQAAYDLEERLIAEYMLPLNKRDRARTKDYGVALQGDEGVQRVVAAFEAIERAEAWYRATLVAALAGGVKQADISRRIDRTREALRQDAMTAEERADLRRIEAERRAAKKDEVAARARKSRR